MRLLRGIMESDRKTVEFVRFGMVGVVATLTHYGLYRLLLLTQMNENVAYTIGYFMSFMLNFVLSSFFTFHTRPTAVKFVRFLSSHGINYLLHMVLFNLYLHLGVSAELAPLFVYMVAVPVNFVLVRFAMLNKWLRKKHDDE